MSDDDNIVQFIARKAKVSGAVAPKLDGVYDILSATIAQLNAKGVLPLTASLDGYIVTIRAADSPVSEEAKHG